MITKVSAKGLKGFEFESSLSHLNILVGPNGTGKTARIDAIYLTALGYVPGGSKKNQDILSTYGSGDKLFVGFQTDDKTHFLRRFCRDAKGSVSSDAMLDRRKTSKEQWAVAMDGIKILDLKAFMEQSDQRKIDTIFSIFPPKGDLAAIDAEINSSREKQNALVSKIKGTEQAIARITSSHAQMQLPAGTLPEIERECAGLEAQIEDVKRDLEAMRLEEAKKLGAEEALKKQAENIPKNIQRANESSKAENHPDLSTKDHPVNTNLFCRPGPDPVASIQAILDTLANAGCEACAAVLVAKRELRKYRDAERRVA